MLTRKQLNNRVEKLEKLFRQTRLNLKAWRLTTRTQKYETFCEQFDNETERLLQEEESC